MDAAIPASKADVLEYIRRALAPGVLYHGSIREMLNSADYDAAWSDALVWFIVRRGVEKRSTLVLSAGTVEYDPPADMEALIEFVQPGSGLEGIAYTGFGFELTGFPVRSAEDGQAMPVSDFAQVSQAGKLVRSALGTNFACTFDYQRRKLIVSPANVTGTAVIRYVSNDISYSALPVRSRIWIRDYALASAKTRLGTIFSKYDNLEGASGTVTLTQRLIDDAELARQALDADILNAYTADMISVG